MELAQAALRGDKPAVRIAGDVQFAAEINWLVEHVRWDLEEDLSRLVGDAPAHAIGDVVRRMVCGTAQVRRPRPQPRPRRHRAAPSASNGPGQAGA